MEANGGKRLGVEDVQGGGGERGDTVEIWLSRGEIEAVQTEYNLQISKKICAD